MQTITQNFKPFDQWLNKKWIEGYKNLNPLATNEDIKKLNDTLGFNIPNELEELLRCHK
jgi:cell wall assembly regulator SMI1